MLKTNFIWRKQLTCGDRALILAFRKHLARENTNTAFTLNKCQFSLKIGSSLTYIETFKYCKRLKTLCSYLK